MIDYNIYYIEKGRSYIDHVNNDDHHDDDDDDDLDSNR